MEMASCIARINCELLFGLEIDWLLYRIGRLRSSYIAKLPDESCCHPTEMGAWLNSILIFLIFYSESPFVPHPCIWWQLIETAISVWSVQISIQFEFEAIMWPPSDGERWLRWRQVQIAIITTSIRQTSIKLLWIELNGECANDVDDDDENRERKLNWIADMFRFVFILKMFSMWSLLLVGFVEHKWSKWCLLSHSFSLSARERLFAKGKMSTICHFLLCVRKLCHKITITKMSEKKMRVHCVCMCALCPATTTADHRFSAGLHVSLHDCLFLVSLDARTTTWMHKVLDFNCR